jgi:hypothetical protein
MSVDHAALSKNSMKQSDSDQLSGTAARLWASSVHIGWPARIPRPLGPRRDEIDGIGGGEGTTCKDMEGSASYFPKKVL